MAISMAGRESGRREGNRYGIYLDEAEMLGKNN